MPLPLRLTALLILLPLSACTTPHLPRVKVARIDQTTIAPGSRASGKLATALSRAAASTSTTDRSFTAYNEAVETFVLELQRHIAPKNWTQPLRIDGKSESWELSFDPRPPRFQNHYQAYPPAYFDRILPARGFKLNGYQVQVSGPGLGVPAVLTVEKELEKIRRERAFRPGNGIYTGATLVLEFGKAPTPGKATPVKLRLINTDALPRIPFAGRQQTLAYDTTSMVEANLGNHYMAVNGLIGLIRPDRNINELGLFGLTAYNPRKIPVVFVHGLGCTANIWRNEVIGILADPALNARYQPLFFLYPTGLSVPGAAARLRESLRLYRQHWDPENDDANFERMVIIGHSMGGLLSRLQATDTGEELRKAFFKRPITDITWMNDAEKATMQDSLILKPSPFVGRIVFIAVPHRGSKLADIGVVQLAVRLIKLPTSTLEVITKAVTSGGMPFLNPELHRYRQLGLRSVDMLSPEHPYFAALERCKITVPCHSIIGDRGKGPGPKCSDGVVPYWSSHLDFAASEKIVPHWHGCVEKPETVAEVLRILRLHLRG